MATINTNPDGTTTTIPAGAAVLFHPALMAYDPGRKIPSLYAAQLAVCSLLSGTVAYVKDDEAIAAGIQRPARKVEIKTAYIDWPKNEAQLEPATATLMEVDDQDFGDEIGVGQYLEHTRDKFGEGTIIRRSCYSTVRLVVHMIFGHRDDRRAFRAEMEDWICEPASDRMGRQVIVPAYYGAQVPITLMGLLNRDDGDAAQKNIWALVATVMCRPPVLRLVGLPRPLRPRLDVDATVPDSGTE